MMKQIHGGNLHFQTFNPMGPMDQANAFFSQQKLPAPQMSLGQWDSGSRLSWDKFYPNAKTSRSKLSAKTSWSETSSHLQSREMQANLSWSFLGQVLAPKND